MTAQAGWEHVVVTLVRERGDALQRFAALLTGTPDDAADLVQDALVRTFGRLRNGSTVANAEAYVRRAIVNAAIDRGRRGIRWRRIAPLALTPSVTPSPTDSTDAQLDMASALKALSPRERACVVLRYYDDLLVDDVARSLGISPGAVKRYLSDAMTKLAGALAQPRADANPNPDPTTGAPHAH